MLIFLSQSLHEKWPLLLRIFNIADLNASKYELSSSLSTLHFFKCLRKDLLLANRFLQFVHWNIFMPLWIPIWNRAVSSFINFLPQIEQMKFILVGSRNTNWEKSNGILCSGVIKSFLSADSSLLPVIPSFGEPSLPSFLIFKFWHFLHVAISSKSTPLCRYMRRFLSFTDL